ncbi:MAG TPA: CBS domain-containing protein [Polyangiaceae bacterium]|nr:CBS domain-containing protein [Polyangiaceae bacterium]
MLQDSPRLVVLGPDASAMDAARAMEDNHIGAVVVSEGEGILGIVTDRDLALRVIGRGRNPAHTPLELVMSAEVAALPDTASEQTISDLMLDRGVRRIPIVSGGRVAGMVTLDDLIGGGQIAATRLAGIIRTQLQAPARLKSEGKLKPTRETAVARERREQRHAARAKGTYDAMLRHVLAMTELRYEEEAAQALEIVVSSVVQRIAPSEGEDLLAQLPSRLRQRVSATPPGPNGKITRRSIERLLKERLRLDSKRAAELLNQIGLVLGQCVSLGEIEDVQGQLPPDLKTLFEVPPPSRDEP